MSEVPKNQSEIPPDAQPMDVPEGTVFGDEDRFYIFDNGRWVDLMELTDDE